MSYCIALVVPVLDRLREYGADHHWSFATDTDLCSLPEARKLIRSEIDRLSPDLAEFERIRNIALLEREFSIESGELTPTLKVKRKVVMENYAGIIEGLVK
jgi:long-chain acyl-CoA synthetase